MQAAEEPEPVHVSEALQPWLLGNPQLQKMEEPVLSCTLTQSSSFDAAADDEFVPGSMCKCLLGGGGAGGVMKVD